MPSEIADLLLLQLCSRYTRTHIHTPAGSPEPHCICLHQGYSHGHHMLSSAVLDSFYCTMLCLCLCLCLSVTSRSSTKMTRRRITQTILHDSQDSSFLVPKIFAKFDRGHPLRGHQMQVGWVKIGDFPQITGCISKTVQDRRMVSIKVEYEVVCALSNGDIADYLECTLIAPNYPIFCILHRHS